MHRHTSIILITVLSLSALVVVALLSRKQSPTTPTCTVEEVLGQVLTITPQRITVEEDSAAGNIVLLPLNEAVLGNEKIPTTVYDDKGRPISLSDIHVGDWIIAHGDQCSATLLTPEWIKKAHPISK